MKMKNQPVHALYIDRIEQSVQSSGDQRKRVDAYFVAYRVEGWNPSDVWMVRFEVTPGASFKARDYPNQKAASAARGYTI